METKYDNNDIKLFNYDNIKFLNECENKIFDLTVTSPPYDGLRDYTSDDKWDFEKFKILAHELYRTTKDGGVLVWNVADQTINGSETGSSFRQALYLKDECGFCLADTMIYRKQNPGGARGSNKTYTQSFEYMFVLSKGPIKTHNLIKDRPNKIHGERRTGGRRNKNGTLSKTKIIKTEEFGKRFNIWDYSTVGDEFSKKHPAPFPYRMAEDHILSWSNEGDIIFDPFSGSGTTLLAAHKNKRCAVGVEISEEYTNLSIQRFEKEIGDGLFTFEK